MVLSSIREEDSLGRTRDSDGIVFPCPEDFDLYMNNEHCSQSPLALLRLLKFLSLLRRREASSPQSGIGSMSVSELSWHKIKSEPNDLTKRIKHQV